MTDSGTELPMEELKICFIQPVETQPRFAKRANQFRGLGVQTKILSFRRKYFKSDIDVSNWIDLGQIRKGKYFLRIPVLSRAAIVVRRESRTSDVLYAYGLDCLFLAILANCWRRQNLLVIYEVADVRPIQVGSSISSKIVRWVERLLLKQVAYVVVTSKAYETEYFRKTQKIDKNIFIVLENKVDSSIVKELRKEKFLVKEEPLRIGYFGLLRCRKTMEFLLKLARGGEGKFEVYIRGFVQDIPCFQEILNSCAEITYEGEYAYPSELPSIYEGVDLVIVAHAHHRVNTAWARGNRFYESGYFGKPMIAQIGTQDGIEVEECGFGLCIDLEKPEEAVRAVKAIKVTDIIKWKKSLKAHHNRFCYADEHADFYREMKEKLAHQ